MMPPPASKPHFGIVWFWPLTPTPKLTFLSLCRKDQIRFTRFQNIAFTTLVMNGRTKERTDGQMDERTDRENYASCWSKLKETVNLLTYLQSRHFTRHAVPHGHITHILRHYVIVTYLPLQVQQSVYSIKLLSPKTRTRNILEHTKQRPDILFTRYHATVKLQSVATRFFCALLNVKLFSFIYISICIYF